MPHQWFIRIIGANPNDPHGYILVGNTPPNCPGSTTICAIYAEINTLIGNIPIIDNTLKNEMILALNKGQNRQRILLRDLN